MNRLFIELYLDEDVDVLVAELVRARGFRAVTTQQAGLLGSVDEAQLTYATDQQMTLLTHNRVDFESLARRYYMMKQTHGGIIIAVRRSPYEIVKRLLVILNDVTADEMRNQIRYI